jgi:hypothetical protein
MVLNASRHALGVGRSLSKMQSIRPVDISADGFLRKGHAAFARRAAGPRRLADMLAFTVPPC